MLSNYFVAEAQLLNRIVDRQNLVRVLQGRRHLILPFKQELHSLLEPGNFCFVKAYLISHRTIDFSNGVHYRQESWLEQILTVGVTY